MIHNIIVGKTGVDLNFSVVRYNPGTALPAVADENTIAVFTEHEITSWAFASKNPYVENIEVNLIADTTLGSGYISASSGTITSQTAANLEVYTEEYIPVRYGKTYTYNYTISATKSMWLAIVEYTGDKVFKQRLVPVDSVSGTSQTGTYTPSTAAVTSVRLSWRTFADTDCNVEFIAKRIDESDNGAVWLYTAASSTREFNAIKENALYIYPIQAYQYIDGELESVDIQIYQNGEWMEMVLVFFENGEFNTSVFGEISGTQSIQSDGSFRLYRNQYVSHNTPVDITPYSTFQFEIPSMEWGYPTVTVKDVSGTTVATFGRYTTAGLITTDVSAINELVTITIAVSGNNNGNTCTINNVKFLP
jgi:hypothetical protein